MSGRAMPEVELATWCEARIESVCTGRAEHRHHRKLRSAGGEDVPANLLDCCSACHRRIHAEVGWSYDRGFLLHSWEEAS